MSRIVDISSSVRGQLILSSMRDGDGANVVYRDGNVQVGLEEGLPSDV